MPRPVIDVFCHWLPERFIGLALERADQIPFMWERARAIPAMSSLSARRDVMQQFPGYTQIPCLSSPAIELLCGPEKSPYLASAANQEMAEIVRGNPDLFVSFVASLPMNNPEASLREARHAVEDLAAAGVQVFTHVNGKPLDQPEFLQVFELMADLNKPVWLHPARGMKHADYVCEEYSKYDLWWALGWPYESSLAMCRLVFSGIFDRHPNLKVITHHLGGIVPILAGRLASGLDMLGTRNPPELAQFVKTPLREKPVVALQRFYADTASFGNRATIECGLDFFGVERLLFASDMPFDPEKGTGYIRETLRLLDEMALPEGDLEKILSGNILRIIG